MLTWLFSYLSVARMLGYRRRSEEPPTGHSLLGPYRPHRDPFLDREYERERIREEILREEVRRRIIEEEVRWELEMELYYGLSYPNLGCQGTWPTVQFGRPRFSDVCYMRGPKPSNRYKGKRWVKDVQHKIMEINEGELVSKPPVSEDKIQPCNEEELQKKKDEPAVQTEENRKKVKSNVGEIPQKIVEVAYKEIRPPQILLKDSMQAPKNQEELRPKASFPKEALPKDKIKPPPNRNNIWKEGDGNKVLKSDSGNKDEKPDFSQSSKVTFQNLLLSHIEFFFFCYSVVFVLLCLLLYLAALTRLFFLSIFSLFISVVLVSVTECHSSPR
jgi:hypothetical protein